MKVKALTPGDKLVCPVDGGTDLVQSAFKVGKYFNIRVTGDAARATEPGRTHVHVKFQEDIIAEVRA